MEFVVDAKANKEVTLLLDVHKHVNAFERGSFIVVQLNVV